jgi:hypothetical protein
MRSLRCDACGTKALMAASQCPSCGHLFQVRDGFGDLLPLAYCNACDSHYPAHVGSCKWCGTTPAPPPNTPRIWKAVGAVAFVGLVGVAWVLRAAGGSPATKTHARPQPISPTPATVVAVTPPAVAPDTPIVALAGEAAPATAPTEPGPPIEPTPVVQTRPISPPARRWIASVARDWAIVRVGPSKSTRIVASVGPGARVQLGESQGAWRRIRARGITGWVESRAAFASTSPSVSRVREVVSR